MSLQTQTASHSGPTAPLPTGAAASTHRTLGRFVAVGLTGNLVYALVFLLLGSVTSREQALNLTATIVSTVLVNDLHRRFSFRGSQRASWIRGQAVGASTATLGLGASSLALAAWTSLAPDASHLSSVLVVYCVNALIGLGNYIALRSAFSGQCGHGDRRRSGNGLRQRSAPRQAHAHADPSCP